VIISDATTIIGLINIDRLDILKIMFKNIILPKEVYTEVAIQPIAKNIIDKEISEQFITIKNYTDKKTFKEINFILDSGESAAITLALETKMLLIIDEKKGRKFALKEGIKVIGLIGILRFLYVEKRLEELDIKEIILRLNQSNFRINDKLIEYITK